MYQRINFKFTLHPRLTLLYYYAALQTKARIIFNAVCKQRNCLTSNKCLDNVPNAQFLVGCCCALSIFLIMNCLHSKIILCHVGPTVLPQLLTLTIISYFI